MNHVNPNKQPLYNGKRRSLVPRLPGVRCPHRQPTILHVIVNVMKIVMGYKPLFTGFFFVIPFLASCESAYATLAIHSQAQTTLRSN